MSTLVHRHHIKHATHVSPAKTFIMNASGPAIASEKATGVPASVTLAQAILESGWGRYHVGKANNYFGIKGSTGPGSTAAKTHEYVHGKMTTITAHFRSYADMTESFTDHGRFLRDNRRYSQAFHAYKTTGSADAFAAAIAKAGYATDPNYAKMLIGLMKKNDLYRYDVLKVHR